jgi:hypothetical protein
MNLLDLLRTEGSKYIRDAMPGGRLNPEVSGQGLLDTLALGTAPVPVVGDIAGLTADVTRMVQNPEERTLGNAALAGLGLLPFVPAMTVFHGSPHLFQKFDASKIGTGEGAQVYGHGLYFAENPAVAGDYARQLGGDPKDEVLRLVSRLRNEASSGTQLSADEVLFAQKGLPGLEPLRNDSRFASLAIRASNDDKGAIKELTSMAESYGKSGNLYQVDLPDEQIARMIDWDKPISQQPKAIQDFALQNAPELVRAVKFQQANPLNQNFAPKNIYDLTGREMYSALQSTERRQKELFKQRDALVAKYQKRNMSMADAVRAMNPEDRAQFSQIADQVEALKNAPAAASSMLRQAGIPGIRYLDQGSRGAGQGTSNFVVFPGMEDMLRIEQINEQPIQSLLQTLGR